MMTLEEAIKHCKDVALSCTNKECALDHFQLLKWLQEYSNMLEKQAKHTKFIESIQIGDKVTRNEDGVLVNLSQLNRVAKPAEKQGEQKPTDKVEPKFKIGDWVVTTYGKVNQIVSVDKDGDGYTLDDGVYFSGSWRDMYHLWTLQDSKDGDVLHSTGFHNDCIFIFNGLDNWKFDEPNGDRAVATGYCCLSVSADKMDFGIQGPDCVEVNTVKPATKIQRDILFQKMKEAGYEWDSEEKELKKIEQKPVVILKFRVGDTIKNKKTNKIFTISDYSLLYEYYHDINHYHEIKFSEQDDWELVEQNPAWSEEDESILFRTINNLKFLKDTVSIDPNYVVNITDMEREINWLESLKDRVQPKQEWSEEDERNLQGVIDEIQANKNNAPYYELETYDRFLNWLKSLKPHSTRKPSDEQMLAIDTAINVLGKGTLNGKHLIELQKLLKKLREE